MKLPSYIRGNLLLKMTSLNAVVVTIRLVISAVVQRLLYDYVGPVGQYKIGQLRSLSQLVMSLSSLGTFSGIVKYVAEYKTDKEQLQKLFSTTFVFTIVGVLVSGISLFLFANTISNYLFASEDFSYLIKLTAVVVPFIAMQRVFNGVINGLSEYKKFAKIDLVSYLFSVVLTLVFLFQYELDGALIAIAITPIIQVSVLLFFFFKTLREYLHFKDLKLQSPMAKSLLAFTLMSFVTSILLPIVEIDIRSMLEEKMSGRDAGVWTNLTFISKNYMVFSGSIFTLYVIPKFAGIYTSINFRKELFNIYKTILPLFAVGMLLVFLFRNVIIELLYPGLTEMAPLFKWQLLGDFIRLASLVLLNQFLAKKLVRNFIFSELFSVVVFYLLAQVLVAPFGVEGVVLAHLIRYILYFILVAFLVFRYFNKQKKASEEQTSEAIR